MQRTQWVEYRKTYKQTCGGKIKGRKLTILSTRDLDDEKS